MSVEITPDAMRKLADRYANDFDMPMRNGTIWMLREAADALEASQARVRELEEQRLDTSINGKWTTKESVKYADTVSAKERARAEQAEARVAVLREALSAYGDESLRDPLTGLEAAAERLLAERKLLRELAQAVADLEAFSPTPNSYVGGQSNFSMTRHQKAVAVRDALTALHEFDAQAGREGEGC